MSEFMIGQWVERKMDGVAGQVIGIETYDGQDLYRVLLSRFPRAADPADDTVLGSAGAWVSHFRIHAHVGSESQDCDGQYVRTYVLDLLDRERQSAFGDHEFRERVLADIVDMTSEGEVRITPAGFTYGQATEEGYRSVVVAWCDEEDCSRGDLTRDLSAEKAGY